MPLTTANFYDMNALNDTENVPAKSNPNKVHTANEKPISFHSISP